MSTTEPSGLTAHERAMVDFVQARLRDDHTAAIRALLDCQVWASRQRWTRRLATSEYLEGRFISVHIDRWRIDDIRASQLKFLSVIGHGIEENVGVAVNPGTDSELLLPVNDLPGILNLYKHILQERNAAAERAAERAQHAQMRAEHAQMMEDALRHAEWMRHHSNTVRDLHGTAVQARDIYGDVYLGTGQHLDQQVPDVPVFVSITYHGHRRAHVSDNPPEYLPVSGDQEIRVLVQGYGARAVILQSLRPVVLSRRSPRPVILGSGYGMFSGFLGELRPRGFDVELGDPPMLTSLGPETFPFTVTQSDPELFVLSPRSGDEIKWRLELDWICADSSGTLVIPKQSFCLHPGPGSSTHFE